MTDNRQTGSANLPTNIAERRLTGQWWLFSGFWLLIALASVLEAWLVRSSAIDDALRFACLQWVPWIILSPVVLWLSSNFTLERSTWLRNVWVQLAAGIIIVGGLGALAYYEGPQPPPRGGGGPPPFGRGEGQGPPRGEPPRFEQPGEQRPPGRRGGGPFPDRDGRGGPRRGPPPQGFMILRLSTFQLPTYLAMLGVAHALLFYQRAKERERRGTELESRLTQARLEALRMQLNPHFLFNTLNSIASLVYDQPRAADEMIGSLSDLLRLTLNSADRQEVALSEELHLLDQYLLIEQARFGDRLLVEKEIDPETLAGQVPILILQPLAENAVKHGLEKQLAPGVVSISARRDGDVLRLTVTDNGRGPVFGEGGQLKEGVGLSNTRGRLRELYGERGSMEYRAGQNGGFTVEIKIPWKTATAPPPVAQS